MRLGALAAAAILARAMNAARKLGLAVAAVAALGAAGGSVGYWNMVAAEAEDRLAQWEAERRAEDIIVSHGPPARSGFPFALVLKLPDFEIARGGRYPLGWRSQSITAEVNPWTLGEATFAFPGKHALVAPVDGRPRPLDVTLDEGRLDVRLDGRGKPRAAALNLGQVDARLADTGERYRIATARVVARRPQAAGGPGAALSQAAGRAPAAGGATVELETDTRIAGLVLPPQQAGPLGPEIKTINVLADVVGPMPAAPTAEEARRWRDAGGYVELKDVLIAWGRLEIRGAGTARLDAELQPDVRLDSRVRNGDAIIDALVATGQMRVPESLLAKAALAALSRPADDGGPPVLRVPITVRDGNRVYLGPVRIARLPALVWR
jgi:hypothetical protein